MEYSAFTYKKWNKILDTFDKSKNDISGKHLITLTEDTQSDPTTTLNMP